MIRTRLATPAVAVTLVACTGGAEPEAAPEPRPTLSEVPVGMSEDEAVRRGLVQGDHLAILDHAFSRSGSHHFQLRNVGHLGDAYELRVEPTDAGSVEPSTTDLVPDGTVTVVVETEGSGELVVVSHGADAELLRVPIPPED